MIDNSDSDDISAWMKTIIAPLQSKQRQQLFRDIARGLRARQAQRVKQQDNPDGSPFEPRKLRAKKGRIKRKSQMFRNLIKTRHLKTDYSPQHVAVGFSGRDARISQTHQEGQIDSLGKTGPLYRYPSRKILGLSADDILWIMETVEKHTVK